MAHLDCDVVIIGAGLGGLTAGALLAKRGKRVIILEQNDHAGGRFATIKREGYIFQASNNIFTGFELGGGHERVAAEIGLLVNKRHLDPAWQLISPNHRINVYSNRVAFLDELKREFPKSPGAIRNFIQRIDEIDNSFFDIYQHREFTAPHTLKERYIFYREIQTKLNRITGVIENTGMACLRQFFNNKEFKKLLDLAVYFHSLYPLENCPILLTAFILSIPKRGVVSFPGGINRLLASLIRYVENGKGEVRYNTKVQKILIEFQQAAGVQLVSGETIRAKHVIANTYQSYLYNNLLDDYNVSGRVRKRLEALKPERLPFSVYLGVNEEIIPEQMRENVFLCTDYKKPIGDTHTLFIHTSPPNDTSCAPKGKRAMTVSAYLPYAEWWRRDENYLQRKEAMMNEILQHLSRLVTFIDEGIEYIDAASPLTYQKHIGVPLGHLTGLAHTSGGFGFNGFSNHTIYKRLWTLGEDTFPGRGSDMLSICALNLTNLICS